MKQDRRDMIKAGAERVRQRQAPKPKPEPKPVIKKPARTSGRWVRTGSVTLTIYDVSRQSLRAMVEKMIQEHAGEIEEPGRKVHVQLTEKVLRD